MAATERIRCPCDLVQRSIRAWCRARLSPLPKGAEAKPEDCADEPDEDDVGKRHGTMVVLARKTFGMAVVESFAEGAASSAR